MNRLVKILASGGLIALLLVINSGCAPSAIVFATSTMAGIELAPAEAGQQTAHIGYKRAEAVIMPTRNKKGELLSEAYPVSSAYRFETGRILLDGLGTTRIHQVFATGKAAEKNAGTAVREAFGFTGSFAETELTVDCIDRWLDADPQHVQELQQWWDENSQDGFAVLLIRTKERAAERQRFIGAKNIPCNT